jgi:hypothetical protein
VNCGQSAEKDFEKESSVTNSLFFGKKFSIFFSKNCQREKLSVPGLGNELELV